MSSQCDINALLLRGSHSVMDGVRPQFNGLDTHTWQCEALAYV